MGRKNSPYNGEFFLSYKLSDGTRAPVGIRILNMVGVELDLAVAAIEVEVRRVVELAPGIR